MARRGHRSDSKHRLNVSAEEVVLEERQAPGVFNLPAPTIWESTLPLRLLDLFTCFTADEEGNERTLHSIDQLIHGEVYGLDLQANGMLLEHKLASSSIEEATAAAYARIQIRGVRDWVVDHSWPPAIWLVTDAAWYRLLRPAPEYAAHFGAALGKVRLLGGCVRVLQSSASVSPAAAVSAAVAAGNKAAKSGRQGGALHDWDPYEGIASQAWTTNDLAANAGFLVAQLATLLGRHASTSPLLRGLSELGGVPLLTPTGPGRPLLDLSRASRSAPEASRPPLHTDFLVEAALQPGVLVIWDFCLSFRELLRLPPFPLARLERAFLDNGGEEPLLKDLHLCLLRVLEGIDVEPQEPPTMAGYGAAAELGPKEVYRPLLPATWPELVRMRLGELCEAEPTSLAAAACEQLKVTEYGKLPSAARLALLDALVHLAASTELVRAQLQERPEAGAEGLPGGIPLGCDDSGARYFQLGGSAGLDRLVVELRSPGLGEAEQGTWGWYDLAEVAAVVAWLDGGSPKEQALAEDLHEAYNLRAQAAAAQSEGGSAEGCDIRLDLPADGYAAAPPEPQPAAVLKADILALFAAVRFWEKDADWLKAHAAILAELEVAETARDLARLLWLVEEQMYTDLLRGTGWGRKRNRFREQLEASKTVAQVAVEACDMALLCRRGSDLGLLTPEEFRDSLKTARAPPSHLPAAGETTVLLRSGYAPHVQQARPPPDALSAPLPRSWGFAERVIVRDVKYARGEWQRPSWQGRFADGPAPPHPGAADLLVACFLVERQPQNTTEAEASTSGEIDWEGFSFQTGFKPTKGPGSLPRPGSAASDMTEMTPPPLGASHLPEKVEAPASSKEEPKLEHPSTASANGKAEDATPPAAPSCVVKAEANGPESAAAPQTGMSEAAGAEQGAAVAAAAAVASEAPAAQLNGSGGATPAAVAPAPQQTACSSGPEASGVRLCKPGALPASSISQPAGMAAVPRWLAQQPPANGSAPPRQASSNSVLLQMLKLPSMTQPPAKAKPAGAPQAEAKPNLRRSSRTRTEVSFSDYEAGDETSTEAARSRRTSADGMHPGSAAMWLPPKAPLEARLDEDGGEDGTGLRYWRRERDLAGIVFYIRKNGNASVEYLLAPATFDAAMQQNWPAGTVVKMPAWGSLAKAASIPNLRWYTGTTLAPFPPSAAAASAQPGTVQKPAASGPTPAQQPSQPQSQAAVAGSFDPWKALTVRWDPGTLITSPPRVSPWEVAEDVGGVTRAANAQALQALLAKQRADAAAAAARGAVQYGAARPGMPHQGPGALAAFSNFIPYQLQGQGVPYPVPGVPGTPQGAVSTAPGSAAFVGRPPVSGQTGTPVAGQAVSTIGWPARPMGMPGSPMYHFAYQGYPGALLTQAVLPHGLPQQPQQQKTGAAPGSGPQRVEGTSRKRRMSEPDPDVKPTPTRPSSEGYRDRWLAKRPRPNPNTWLSGFCSACERAGGGSEGPLMTCMGPCLRAFHATCVGLSKPPEDPSSWFCPECDTGCMACFLCGKFGGGFSDSSVRKCSLGVCGRFYHLECAKAAPLAQLARKGGHFRCPQHYCMKCGRSGDGMDMAKCIRCPTAYHSICMQNTAARRLHPHSKVVLCEKHAEEEGPPGYKPPPALPPTSQPAAEGAAAAAAPEAPEAQAQGDEAGQAESQAQPDASKPVSAGTGGGEGSGGGDGAMVADEPQSSQPEPPDAGAESAEEKPDEVMAASPGEQP